MIMIFLVLNDPSGKYRSGRACYLGSAAHSASQLTELIGMGLVMPL
jgi:hypothetical protein